MDRKNLLDRFCFDEQALVDEQIETANQKIAVNGMTKKLGALTDNLTNDCGVALSVRVCRTKDTADPVVDPDARSVTVHGDEVILTTAEFDLLHALASRPGRTFSRSQLLDQVWGYDFYGDPSTVTVHIRRLRENPTVAHHVIRAMVGVSS